MFSIRFISHLLRFQYYDTFAYRKFVGEGICDTKYQYLVTPESKPLVFSVMRLSKTFFISLPCSSQATCPRCPRVAHPPIQYCLSLGNSATVDVPLRS